MRGQRHRPARHPAAGAPAGPESGPARQSRSLPGGGAGRRFRVRAGRWLRAVFAWSPESLAWRLWRGLVVFILLFAAAGLLVYSGVHRQAGAMETVARRLEPLQTVNVQVRSDFSHAQSVLNAYTLSRRQLFRRLYRTARSDLAAGLAKASQMTTGVNHTDVEAQAQFAEVWFVTASPLATMAASDPRAPGVIARGIPSSSAFYQANDRLHARLQRQIGTAIANGQAALRAGIIQSTVLAVVAFLLGLLVVVGTVRGVAGPLRGITATLRRLTSGDHDARAEVSGPAEAREVSRSVNALADESDRLRLQQEESDRLRRMARAAGLRIREHLRAEDVIDEARRALEENIDADHVYLQVATDEGFGPAVGHADDGALAAGFMRDLPAPAREFLVRLLRTQTSLVVDDMSSAQADHLFPHVRDALREAGVVAHLLTPFGVGAQLLGIIAAARMRPGRPWTRPEVDAVESIAADLGRGLYHARLYEDENRLVGELQAVDRVKSDFLAAVSHELRTPLTSIAGYTELLLDKDAGPLNESQERMLSVVGRNTTRLRHLIEDVLTLSKIESGAFKSVLQPVDLAEVVSSAAAALSPEAAGKQLSLRVDLPDRPVVVNGDAGHLDRMVMNLLANAVKFTPPGGRVTASVAARDAVAVVRVIDSGIGIPSEDQKRLFTRFFRAANAVERSIPGTGLGLSIVRTIVDNHGGSLGISSEEGKGTEVTVRIPLLSPGAADRRVGMVRPAADRAIRPGGAPPG